MFSCKEFCSARVRLVFTVNGLNTSKRYFIDVTSPNLLRIESVEPKPWLFRKFFPVEVVPTFVNVFIHLKEICVGFAVVRSLEFCRVDINFFMSKNVFQEILHLRKHSDVTLFEMHAKIASAAGVQRFYQHLIIKS